MDGPVSESLFEVMKMVVMKMVVVMVVEMRMTTIMMKMVALGGQPLFGWTGFRVFG